MFAHTIAEWNAVLKKQNIVLVDMRITQIVLQINLLQNNN